MAVSTVSAQAANLAVAAVTESDKLMLDTGSKENVRRPDLSVGGELGPAKTDD